MKDFEHVELVACFFNVLQNEIEIFIHFSIYDAEVSFTQFQSEQRAGYRRYIACCDCAIALLLTCVQT